ncbi:MAG: hypothetical protein IKK70_04365 [Clostridia bacterium]|nr:hypothetical protein [Clostridia bacterium]
MNGPELIVMLTRNDLTVENAYEIFDECKNTKAEYWGFKEEGISFPEMKKLCAYIKECGKTAVLEAVAYTEGKCLSAASVAKECGFDILMGTLYYDSVNDFCIEHGIKYMPFIGEVSGRPSVLKGSAEEMIRETNHHVEHGAFGVDLLGYRYVGDCVRLNRELVCGVDAPVCVAGSIDSVERLDEIKRISPWAFTVGSAFFENKFGDSFASQVDFVCDYLKG